MKLVAILLSAVALVVGCTSKPSEPENRAPAGVGIDTQMKALLDVAQRDGKLPAVGALVTEQGRRVFFGVQGKRALQKEALAQVSDKWHLGSDTKAMTAFLIALAIQEKKLSYDTKVVQFYKGTPKVHHLNSDLTIADLLSHGSALKDLQEVQGGTLWKELFKSPKDLRTQRLEMSQATLAEAPHMNLKKPSLPDRSFNYANMNYVILGSILEKIYSSDWETLIRDRLFGPLQMSSCGFGVAGDAGETEPSQPWPHVLEKGQLIGVPPKHKVDNPPMLGPAGTVHCGLEDWQKFMSELMLAWHGHGSLLKDRAVVTRYFSNARDSIYTFGGWGQSPGDYKTPIFQHNGSNTFNYAVAVFAPEKNASILLVTNSGQPEVEEAMQKLKKAAAALLLSRAE